MSSAIKTTYQQVVPLPVRTHIYRMRTDPRRLVALAWAMCTDSTVRQYRQRLLSLKDSYRGHRCFIMGNGPSLNQMDLNKLKNDFVWGMNRCHLLFDRISWRPAFYTAVDKRVVPDNRDEINQWVSQLPDTLFFFPLEFRLRGLLESSLNTYWYREIAVHNTDPPHHHFSLSVVDHVRERGTVTLAAMQIAVFLGFNPIYLIGCDTNYQTQRSVVYEDAERNLIIATHDDDVNHFDPTYFGAGKKYHEPCPERMILAYHQAKRVCDGIGVRVYNATVGGKLEVFPRVEFNSLFE